MNSNLPQSKSVPLNLAIGRRHRVSISGSGSYQSHLSSLGHLHRVRTTSEQLSLRSIDSDNDYLRVPEGDLVEQRSRIGRFSLLKQFIADPPTFLSDDLRRLRSGHVWRPRTLVTLYCCFCLLFLTVKIHTVSWNALQATRAQSWLPTPNLADTDIWRHASSPPLMNITLSQRLSLAFRGLPAHAHLETFVALAQPSSGHKSDLTACLWVEDAQFDDALVSTAMWPGPVSLVVVTTHTPNSTAFKILLDHLTAKHASNTSVHVLYVSSVAGASSNTYLNMARFFARTSRVVLFPDGIPVAALSNHGARWLAKLPMHTPHPVLWSNTTSKAFSPRLLPVVLPRDHPVWCTERWYVFGSRSFDWDDCLWRLWFESAGEASSVAVPRLVDGFKNATLPVVSPFAVKIRLRWSAKYRSEACAFTLKRSQAVESLSKIEKKHMHWRKKFCRETVGPGVLDMP